MNLDLLKGMALAGGDWVIWLLLASSVLALAVIIERAVVLTREGKALLELRGRVGPILAGGALAAVATEAGRSPGLVAKALAAGAAQAGCGPAAVEEHLAAAGLEGRREMERRLIILGTLGNNAPFVGLFGTVLGVIQAFHDLSQSSAEGPEAVMRGLSEALVATAVGLFVAIPCVIAYNYFQKHAKDLLADGEALNRLLLARLKSEHGG